MAPDKRTSEPSGLAGYSPPLLRPRSKFRWCASVLLNLLLLIGAGGFWQYLHSGNWFDFTAEAFRRNLTTSLGTVLLQPLDIFSHPLMILIAGLTLAVLIILPITIAVMYQLLLALLFVVIVAVLAHAPFLALALAVGCFVAARTRLRRDYPFLAILMGLIPVCLFLYLLAYPGIDAVLLPLQRWILAMPFFLAILLSIFLGGMAVLLAKLLKFQPGVIWPGAIILLGSAVGLFYWQIGPGELQYSLLTKSLASGNAIFSPIPRDEWVRLHGAGLNEQTLLLRILDDLEQRLAKLNRTCDGFLHRFPKSNRAPSIAWLGAQCKSLQLDTHSLENKLISYKSSHTKLRSDEAWKNLLKKYPNSPHASLALWHIGILQLRQSASLKGQAAIVVAKEAYKTLRLAEKKLQEIVQNHRNLPPTSQIGVFRKLTSLPSPQDYENLLFQVECLNWKIARNDVLTEPNCAIAMARLLDANPYAPQYNASLKILASDPAFSKTKMADNLQIAVARLNQNIYDRAEAMKAVAEDQRSDAAIEAFYELGRISMQTASASVIRLTLKAPEEYFKVVIAAPRNPWQGRAAENLAWLQATSASNQEP